MSKKRKIISHKGGRTAQLNLTIKPEIKNMFETLVRKKTEARSKKVSKSDLVEEWVVKEWKRIED